LRQRLRFNRFRFQYYLCCARVDIPQDFHHLIVFRLFIDIIDLGKADGAIPVDDKYRPFGVTLGAQNPIAMRNPPMRPKIAQQRIIYASQAFCPGLQCGYMIDADAQNLSI
jgi:hypothetical protein